jgi:MtN3 and saliva related transmembrane protein
MSLMSILATLATAFGIGSGLFNLPQIIKIFQRKSAKDISVITYIGLLAGTVVWILYGLELNNMPIILTNGFAGASFILILLGCYLYGK